MPEKKQSAFKQLYIDMFMKGGDFTKLADSIPKKKINCYVKEAYPHFLIADDFFSVPCHFTQKAIDDFKSKNSNVKVTDLGLRVIELSNWTLEMVKVDSSSVFTSYGGLQLRIIVKEFSLNSKQGVSKVNPNDLARFPVNIYRDDEVKTAIQSYTHSCVSNAVGGGVKGETLPDIGKFTSKANVGQGIVKFANGDKFAAWGFKEGKTHVVSMETVHRAEKGSKGSKGSVAAKPKVIGGKKAASKAASKSSIGSKLAKYTPGAKDQGKVSKVQKTGTTPKTPGNKASVASVGRLNKSSYDQFKKFLKKK